MTPDTIDHAAVNLRAKEMILAGASYQTILDELPISATQIYRIRDTLGVTKPRIEKCPATPDQVEYIRDNIGKLSITAMAEACGHSYTWVRTVMRQNDIPYITKGSAPPKPEEPIIVVDDKPFISRSGILAKRNKLGVSMPYIPSLD